MHTSDLERPLNNSIVDLHSFSDILVDLHWVVYKVPGVFRVEIALSLP